MPTRRDSYTPPPKDGTGLGIAALTSKLKLAREGLEDIKANCQGPAYGWVEVRAERILEAIGGGE